MSYRQKGGGSSSVTFNFPWNTLGEFDVQEGGGRQASAEATFTIGVYDYTGCGTNQPFASCASLVTSRQVQSYSKSNSGIVPYRDSGRDSLQVTLVNRHSYVPFIKVETKSTSQGAFTSPSTGYSIVDFFGGANRGWLSHVSVTNNSGKWASC